MATLINVKEVIEKAPTDSGNFDPRLLSPHIITAEYRHIMPVLGKTYYEALVTAAAGDASNNLTSHNLTLWTLFLHELCARAVLFEAMPFIWVKVSSHGAMKANTDHGQSAGTAEMKLVHMSHEQAIKALIHAMDDYLTHADNSANYSTYRNNADCDIYNSTPSFGVLGLKKIHTRTELEKFLYDE